MKTVLLRWRRIGLTLLVAIVVLGIDGTSSVSQAAPQPPERTLSVRADHNYPPYEFLADGEPMGFNIDLIRAVADVMGLDIDIRLGPWQEVRGNLESGDIDVLAGMYFSEARDAHVDFSVPHTRVSPALFVRQRSSIRSLDDVLGEEILVQEGDVMHDYLRAQDDASQIIPVTDPVDALRMLSIGWHDAALLSSKVQGLYLIDKFEFDNLTTVDIEMTPRDYCFAVQEGDEVLVQTLNEGLNVLKATGRYKEIYDRWFGVYERQRSWEAVKPFVWAGLILLSLLGGVLIWLWTLRREVVQRTQALSMEVEQRSRIEKSLRASEERFHSIFEASPIGIGLVDGAGNILECNQALSDIVGYSREELMKMTGATFTHPEDLEKERVLVKALWAGKVDTYAMVKRYLHKEGHTIWVHVHVSLLKARTDQAQYALAFINDITERRRTENALRESEKQFKLFMRYLPGAVFIKDAEDRLIFCNKRFADLVGRSPEDLIGKTTAAYMTQEERERRRYDLENARVLAERQPMIYEHTFASPEGSTHWLTYKFPIPREGKPSLLGAMSLEITQRKQMEKQLREREERLQALFENALNAIVVLDDQGDFVMTNPAAAKMFGLSPKMFEQANITDLKTPSDVDVQTHLERYRREEQASGELAFFTADGQKRVALYHAVRVRDDFNLCILNDITERRRAEAGLRRLNDELEERIAKRTAELQTMIDAMTGREVRMAELKEVIQALRAQLEAAGLNPVADDPLLGDTS